MDWGRVREIFEEALERPEAERRAWVESRCGDDRELAREVLRLIDAAPPGTRFLEDPPAPEPKGSDTTLLMAGMERSGGAAFGERYELRGEIARGGMGEIHEAWDSHLRRTVALKVLRADVAATADELLARFVDEAQVTGQLEHPGIVPVYDFGVDDRGRVFYTMPRVRGRDMSAIFELVASGSEGWNRARALGALLSVAETLSYAHARGVIHRDLKPPNVMIGKFGEVYVMDWGIARVVRQSGDAVGSEPAEGATIDSLRQDARETPGSPLLTMEGAILGTPAYMAPEQARGDLDEIDARSDVYALGSMLYELLVGRAPYVPAEGGAQAREILVALYEGPPARVDELAPDAPPELCAITKKAMARKRENRYADTSAMADDLRAYLEGRVVGAYATGVLPELRKWIARNRALSASILAVLIAVVLGVRSVEQVRAAERDKLTRYSDVGRLNVLVSDADELWPAIPELTTEMRAWLARADRLLARLPEHRAFLADVGSDPRDEEQAKLVETVESLVSELEALESSGGVYENVEERIAFATTVVERTLEGPDAAARWGDAIAVIEDIYGLEITPQRGLLPLGLDPQSGLFEFAHVQSGSVPTRGPDETLVREPDCCIVLVLIPGGSFEIGSRDPPYPHERAPDGSNPRVELDAFFFSKYELTQAQWRALSGESPSTFVVEDGGSDLYPVEWVHWEEADRWLRRVELELPTEAQWEYACRAGSTTRYWFGDDWHGEDVTFWSHFQWRHVANVGQPPGESRPDPTGSDVANPFGLNEMLGNVCEWCRDPAGTYTDFLPGDGLREPEDSTQAKTRMMRGGSHDTPADLARSAFRGTQSPTTRTRGIGVRASRAIAD